MYDLALDLLTRRAGRLMMFQTLRSAGKRVLTRPAHEIYLCEPQAPDSGARMPLGSVLAALGPAK